ncbi:hypothetical protein SAMN04488109_5614 [Chryseolinea serpens]|uniref:Uncharacterized protein n=1 Tax=Chryseolinea serpens TaxID=947013 RepID=A0A1M5WDU8_9BACT|nr:hypothetical protein [Chryseolinea serpens]SHH85671.1 hypothetical protein SAMN04488109_5614 [Chryseolinea serpens]
MDKEMTPNTIIELEKWMKENCFNFNGYSINGNSIDEGLGIDKFGSLFVWYYTERGQTDNLKYFRTEKEIVEFAFNEIKSDKWANRHCIGFTTEKTEAKELTDKLNELNVEYTQDKIPYNGPNQPAYMTFVLGCDINKVSHLKDRYYKRK